MNRWIFKYFSAFPKRSTLDRNVSDTPRISIRRRRMRMGEEGEGLASAWATCRGFERRRIDRLLVAPIVPSAHETSSSYSYSDASETGFPSKGVSKTEESLLPRPLISFSSERNESDVKEEATIDEIKEYDIYYDKTDEWTMYLFIEQSSTYC